MTQYDEALQLLVKTGAYRDWAWQQGWLININDTLDHPRLILSPAGIGYLVSCLDETTFINWLIRTHKLPDDAKRGELK